MPAPPIIELRRLLSERFPGRSTSLKEEDGCGQNRWMTNLAEMDAPVRGLPRGKLTEIVAGEKSSGSASLARAMLDQAAWEQQLIAMVDGSDSLDVTGMKAATLARMLWVRCHSAEEAAKAADLILRDNNFTLVLLDLAGNSSAQCRKIPATTWYRLQRLVEETPMVCAVLTPRPMVDPAPVRITLRSRFSMGAIDGATDEWLRGLRLEVSDSTRFQEFAARHSA
jgi:hypothetical protein